MFEQVVENLCKVTDSTIQMQQDVFKKLVSLWPTVPSTSAAIAEPLALQKKGLEIVGEIFKKECETLETQFSAGLRNIEEAFHLVKAKDPEEFRSKSLELWQKGFEAIRETSTIQIRDLQSAAAKWTDLVTKGAA
jgi:predicted CopG family antitoxin